MKIKKIGIGIVIGFSLLIGGSYLSQINIPLDVSSKKNNTAPTQSELITYLQKHEKEMTDGVKG